MQWVENKEEALKAVKALGEALVAMNAAGGEMAFQRPATPYSKVSNALKESFHYIAVEDGYAEYRTAQAVAEIAYQAWLDGNAADEAYAIAVSNWVAIATVNERL